jgi:glycosyltransferase involved in cell wall biosynthesis
MSERAEISTQSSESWRGRIERDLTIVIPAYNCDSYLAAAVESALHTPAGCVLLADDRSDAPTRQVMSSLAARHPGRVRLLHSSVQRGTAMNLNRAVEHVETPYFAKLDADDVLIPGYIEAAFPLIASTPEIGILAGRELRIGADEVLEFKPELLPRFRSSQQPKIMAGAEAYRFILTWSPNPCSSGTIYRTDTFRSAGGYDAHIRWGEDWEIWLRIAQRSLVAYWGANSALYRIHQASTTAAVARENRLCYGYEAVFRRAAELCHDPEVRPLLRRAFLGVAKLFAASASRQLWQSRGLSLDCCRQALRALSSAATL